MTGSSVVVGAMGLPTVGGAVSGGAVEVDVASEASVATVGEVVSADPPSLLAHPTMTTAATNAPANLGTADLGPGIR